LIRTNRDYNSVALSSLAASLARNSGQTLFLPSPIPSETQAREPAAATVPPTAPGAESTSSTTRQRRDLATDAASCVLRSAGLPPSTATAYLEAATFDGTPAYIGAFRTNRGGSRPYLVVVATARADCRAIQVVSRRL
jgi:hypothetical protein